MISAMPHKLLLVHAHPDDESIATGGTIARYSAEGTEVTLVTCTLGEEGQIIPPDLSRLGYWAADQLGGYRSGELAAACAALGVSDHHYLGGIGRWRDSGMAGTGSGAHPRAFTGGSPAEQVVQLDEILDEVRPQVIVTYDAFGGYGHPDHIRAHEITMEAAAKVGSVRRVFHVVSSAEATSRGLADLREVEGRPLVVRMPASGELPCTADAHITTRFDIGEYVPDKLAALRAHATQLRVFPAWEATGTHGFALANNVAQPIPGHEYFVLAEGPVDGAETDLFGGL